ncbi:MAG: integral rane sensor signal transduction histidine kinase, partial [Clostridiales bacterium]|nr:integral rane sensor signal transduction histidine kinase [Clostridiales bacterium]
MNIRSAKYIQNISKGLLLIITFGFMYYVSLKNYLIPHTLMELTGAVVSMTIFSIGWNTHKYGKNNCMIVLAIGYLFVGLLTVFHTLSYTGMGVFPEHGTNMPTQFWIAARYVESITLLISFISLKKKKVINSNRVLGQYLFISALIITSIFIGIFPICFIEEKGLTFFKIISEYVICTILLFSVYHLWKQKNKFEADIFRLILISILFTILSELSFTLYIDPFGFMNLLGHFFMIISIIFIYISLVQGNLTKPYKLLFKDVSDYAAILAEKNKELEIKHKAIASSLNAFVLTDVNGNITYVNESFL